MSVPALCLLMGRPPPLAIARKGEPPTAQTRVMRPPMHPMALTTHLPTPSSPAPHARHRDGPPAQVSCDGNDRPQGRTSGRIVACLSRYSLVLPESHFRGPNNLNTIRWAIVAGANGRGTVSGLPPRRASCRSLCMSWWDRTYAVMLPLAPITPRCWCTRRSSRSWPLLYTCRNRTVWL